MTTLPRLWLVVNSAIGPDLGGVLYSAWGERMVLAEELDP